MNLTPLLALCAIQGQAPVDWTEQTLTGGITLSAPVKLALSSSKPQGPDLSRSDLWMGSKANCVFIVSIAEMKDPAKLSTPTALSGVATGIFQKPGMVILGDKDLVLQGWPGIAVTGVSSTGGAAATRIFRCGDLVVTVGVSFPVSGPRPPEVDRFLDSLHLPITGALTNTGTEMKRFPLGNSGISVLMPGEPTLHDVPISTAAGQQTLHGYLSQYGMRSYLVGYIDMPKSPTDADLQQARDIVAGQFVKPLQGKITAPKDFVSGPDHGFSFEFTTEGRLKGKFLVYLHKSQIIYVLEMAPRAYDYAKQVDRFLLSVEFK